MKLTDTQLMLLSAASQREDHGIELGPNLKGGAAQKLVRKLLTESLIEEVRTVGSLPVWRRDDDNQSIALRITKRGLAAIQVDEGGAHPDAARGAGIRLSNSRPRPAGGIRSRPG